MTAFDPYWDITATQYQSYTELMLTHLLEAKTNHPMTSKLVWYPFKITRRAVRCKRAYVFFHATHLGALVTSGERIVTKRNKKRRTSWIANPFFSHSYFVALNDNNTQTEKKCNGYKRKNPEWSVQGFWVGERGTEGYRMNERKASDREGSDIWNITQYVVFCQAFITTSCVRKNTTNIR